MSLIYDIPLLGPLIETLFTVVAPFLVVLSIVVFIHELGHYLVGKWCGIKAEVFSIGFGRELYGWTDRRGTRWRVALLPLGGYVKFKGDADAASVGTSDEVVAMSDEERRQTLPGAPLWARTLTILAGPFANFLLTIVIVFCLTLARGVASDAPVIGAIAEAGRAAAAGLEVGDRVLAVGGQPIETFVDLQLAFERAVEPTTEIDIVRDGRETTLVADLAQPARVADVTYGGPADVACVVAGDLVVAVNDEPISSFQELRRLILSSEGAPLRLTLERDGETVTRVVEPEATDTLDPRTRLPTRRYMLGVVPEAGIGAAREIRPATVGDALSAGVGMPILVAEQTFGYIGAWISGEADGSQLNSLIGIANTSGQALSIGLLSFINLIALISAAIGLMNLLPIPILDGGHLVLYGVEAVRGKPIGEKSLEVVTAIGLAAILLLMVFATANDLTPWFNKLTGPSC